VQSFQRVGARREDEDVGVQLVGHDRHYERNSARSRCPGRVSDVLISSEGAHSMVMAAIGPDQPEFCVDEGLWPIHVEDLAAERAPTWLLGTRAIGRRNGAAARSNKI
jgi:hypothetical protein